MIVHAMKERTGKIARINAIAKIWAHAIRKQVNVPAVLAG